MIETAYEDLLNNPNMDLVRDKSIILMIRSFTYTASVTITSEYENRIDLISYDSYGSVDLWWIIAIYNKIIDPFNFSNQVILIPSITDIQNYLVNKLIERNNI